MAVFMLLAVSSPNRRGRQKIERTKEREIEPCGRGGHLMARLPKSLFAKLGGLVLNDRCGECEHKWTSSHELPAMHLSVFRFLV